MSRPPILIVSDLHLGPIAPAGTEAAVIGLLQGFPGSELICLGDLFDLSAETRSASAVEAAEAHFAHFGALTQALRSHLASGGSVTLVVGNHDAELGSPNVEAALLRYLDVKTPRALTIAPWWLRRAGLHFEHGHVWDPDNAPIHPLSATRHGNEPLGVALTRNVLAPTGAFQFAHAHQTTPLNGLLRALRELRVRAPEIILRYFVVGARIFWQAASGDHAATQREGANKIAEFAAAQGIAPSIVQELTKLRPVPRHADPAATFARLYFDRAAATVLSVVAGTMGCAQRDPNYVLVAAVGALYLVGSRRDRPERYSGSLLRRIESAATAIAAVVKARAVVFGHTHVAQAKAGYVNAGSFGFPNVQGRPYLLLEDGERLARGWYQNTGNGQLESLNKHLLATS